MACNCEECGKPTNDCSERLCGRCLIESLPDDASKNLATGGRFYGEKPHRVDNPVGHVEDF